MLAPDSAINRSMRQERLDLHAAHLQRVAFAVIEDEARHPVDIRLFRPIEVVFSLHGES